MGDTASSLDSDQVAAIFAAADTAVEDGRGLKGTGFWKAVARLREDRDLAREFAPLAGRIDTEAFLSSVRLRVPASAGVVALTTGTLAGIAALIFSSELDEAAEIVVFLAGFGAVLISSHSLAHYVVGRLAGIKFTHAFLGGPPPPRPGFKIDYGTYLLVVPRVRAVMHASGAIVTKVIPFALMPLSPVGFVRWLLGGIGAFQIATDVLFSTKTSDWKRAIREWKAAS